MLRKINSKQLFFLIKKNNSIIKASKTLVIGALLLFVFTGSLYAQNKNIDSLWTVWNNQSQSDTSRLKAIQKIIWNSYLFTQPDSAFYFAQLMYSFAQKKGLQKYEADALNTQGVSYSIRGNLASAIQYFTRSLKIKEKIGDKNGVAYALCNIGSVYKNQGEYANSIDYYIRGFKIFEVIGDKKHIAISFNNIGEVYRLQGNYPLALDKQLNGLKSGEAIGDKQIIANSYNGIGIIYMAQHNYPLALENYFKSLKSYKEIKDKQGISKSYLNIGIVYTEQGNYPLALENLLKGLKIAEELGDKQIIAISYNNIGTIYINQNNYPLALENYLKGLKIFEELGDKSCIADSYNNISLIFEKQKQPLKAIESGNKGLALAKEIGSKEGIKEAHQTLSKIYFQIKDYKKAYENFQLFSQYKDSLVNEESSKQLGHLKTNYAVEKKEIEMKAEQKIERTITEEKSRKQKIIIWSVACGLFLVVVFAGFIFRSLRITRKQKNIIEIQKNEVSEQKEIVEKQKHLVEEHQKEIIDSITYAKRLQKAILPRRSEIHANLPESFILYKPKDIVAGDFYWAEKVNDYYYIGPVVGFRSKEYFQDNYQNGTVFLAPLFWLHNVKQMILEWPISKPDKGQYIRIENESKSILIPNKNYILLRRFSSKDDKSRLIAAPYFCNFIKSEYIGVENKVNYIYRPKGHLDRNEIVGLCALLNSTLFDSFFRIFNGNVNVSATELREIPLPTLETIKEIGNNIILSNDFSVENTNKTVIEQFELSTSLYE